MQAAERLLGLLSRYIAYSYETAGSFLAMTTADNEEAFNASKDAAEKWGSQAREVFVQLSLVAPRKTLHWLEESFEPVVEKFEKATDESLEAGDNTPLEELTEQLFDLLKKAGPVLRAEVKQLRP